VAPSWGASWAKGVQPSAAGQWTEVVLDVTPFAGAKVAVEVFFNTVDGAGNAGLGVLLDELRWTSSCVVTTAPGT
jgi:hypothetical protein